eukprot:965742-Prymnesium_polylepis.1
MPPLARGPRRPPRGQQVGAADDALDVACAGASVAVVAEGADAAPGAAAPGAAPGLAPDAAPELA